MAMRLADLACLTDPFTAIVHSFERSLYQVTVCVDGTEHLLQDDAGKTFRRRSINAVREALAGLPIEKLTLRQQSAYDEMIGQPLREGCNSLEVGLALPESPSPE